MRHEGMLNAVDKIEQYVLDNSFKNGRKFDIEDGAIIALIERETEIMASIDLLIDAKLYDSVNLLERSFLEAAVSLEYILKADTYRRGRAFRYGYETQLGNKFINLGSHLKDSQLKESIKKDIEKDIINTGKSFKDGVKDKQERYDQCFDSNVKRHKPWYNQNGHIKNMHDLMSYLGRSDDYLMFYDVGSLDVHSLSSNANLKISPAGKYNEGNLEVHHSSEKYVLRHLLMEYAVNSLKMFIGYYKVERAALVRSNWALFQANLERLDIIVELTHKPL